MTLQELSVLYAKKQPKQVDQLTRNAPFLDIVPFEEASHDFWNMYEEVTEVTGAGFVKMNAPLSEMKVESDLKKIDLNIMGGKLFCPEDKARSYGGAAKYFAKKTPLLLRKSGMSAEYSILYDNIRAAAIDLGNVVDAGGEGYSIIVVRFIPGETGGLYSPVGFKNGALLDAKALNGGNVYEHKDTGVNGFGMYLKNYFGFMIANAASVAVVCNIDADHKPTSDMLDDALDMAEADNGSTHMVMHPNATKFMSALKEAKLQVGTKDNEYNNQIDVYNKIPITTTRIMLKGTEAAVEVA